jgi:large subunit ribosomal protein L15
MKLNQLSDNPGAHKPRMRVARGIGSGKGKTAGRGGKGQKGRSGVAIKGFEGGQMPLFRRLPKRGFNNPFRKEYALVNLGTLQSAVEAGKLEAGKPVDAAVLQAAGIVRHLRDGVRLLGKGEVKAALQITVTGASKAAIEAIEKAGGKVTLLAPVEAEAA